MMYFIIGILIGMILMFTAQLPKHYNERKRDRFNVLSVLRQANLLDDDQYEIMLRERENIDIVMNPKHAHKKDLTLTDRERMRLGIQKAPISHNAKANNELYEPISTQKKEVKRDG